MRTGSATRRNVRSIGWLGVGLVATLLLASAGRATAQAGADLALTKSAAQDKVKLGQTITYTITITNNGPATATGIVFGDPLPDLLNLVSFTCGPPGQGIIDAGIVQPFCRVDSLAPGASASATMVATPIPRARQENWITNTSFVVEAATPDPDSGNNSASATVKVHGKPHR